MNRRRYDENIQVGREEFRIPARYTFISVYGSIKII